jgi:hypothetical protein
MGLITFFLLGAFSLIYISSLWNNKPDFVQKAVDFLRANLGTLAMVGVFYGLLVALLTPIMIYNSTDLIVRLIANLMIFVMALPFAFDRLVEKYGHKMNTAIIDEVRSVISHISAREKYVGIAGAAITVLLFAVLFR